MDIEASLLPHRTAGLAAESDRPGAYSCDDDLLHALRDHATYHNALRAQPGLTLRDAVLEEAAGARATAWTPGVRAAVVLTALDRYDVPYAFASEWCAVAGPFAVHIDALTACRVVAGPDGALTASGGPQEAPHTLTLLKEDERAQVRLWALLVALEVEGAGEPVEEAFPKAYALARSTGRLYGAIAEREATLTAARAMG